MADQRKKNREWVVADNDGTIHLAIKHGVFLAVLMDQRDALKEIHAELVNLNRILNCPHFLGIPHTLRGIRRNTTKRKRKTYVQK